MVMPPLPEPGVQRVFAVAVPLTLMGGLLFVKVAEATAEQPFAPVTVTE